MSNLISNLNTKNSISDAAINIRENINYIKKFVLSLSIAKYINSQLIFNNININNLTIVSNIEFHSYIFHCYTSY